MGAPEKRWEWSRAAHCWKANILRRSEVLGWFSVPKQLATENCVGTESRRGHVRVSGEVSSNTTCSWSTTNWRFSLIFMDFSIRSRFRLRQISTSPPRFIHYNVRVNGKLSNFQPTFCPHSVRTNFGQFNTNLFSRTDFIYIRKDFSTGKFNSLQNWFCVRIFDQKTIVLQSIGFN